MTTPKPPTPEEFLRMVLQPLQLLQQQASAFFQGLQGVLGQFPPFPIPIPPGANLESIELVAGGSTVDVGDTLQLMAVGHYDTGQEVDISLIAQWGITDGGVASINSMGLLSGEAPGSVTITATYLGVSSAPLTVTVLEDVANHPPVVALEDVGSVQWPERATLVGDVADPDGDTVTHQWIVEDHPPGQSATFLTPDALTTEVEFTGPGAYRITLEANDGQLQGRDTIHIEVLGTGSALIQNLEVSTGKILPVVPLEEGERLYIDRSYTFTAIPTFYQGFDYIQGSNEDKANQDAAYMRWDAPIEETVWILWDPRHPLPSWMNNFESTGDIIATNDGGPAREVYKRDYPIGPIVLPGRDA